ncbi:hypothetical protein PSTEL_22765 [Paenibacillus stellifer]|uniref:Phage shock protein PspC N-terminal domain-containing protein n=1 Tax=Paenibacillus stellifer TaxID=169760 RepID=A0A089LX90_9BACL|nr:PspC domain-containing protein [Paenibacillus stellifer]AIQ65517.1 hypothetical protein PSTEL_22765 [Paenibacillus stellifer]
MTRLYRSTRDKVLTGLTGGLAETIGIDSTLLRILLLISIPFTGGAVIPVYLIAALIFPKEVPPYYPPPFGFGPEAAEGGYGPYHKGHDDGYARRGCDPKRPPFGPYGPHGSQHGRRPYEAPGPRDAGYGRTGAFGAQDSGLDDMMKDIEKKAMQKEIEELKRKLAQYENEKGDK